MKRLLLIAWILSLMPVTPALAGERIAFSYPDLQGTVHTQSEYRGKWVVVNYWATSCPPCIKEIPELAAFHRRHQDRDVVLLGVDFEDISPSWLKDFMESMSMKYTVLRAGTSPETPFGTVTVLPTTFIVSPAGELEARQVGTVTADGLDAYFARKTGGDRADAPATGTGTRNR
jgi:thiol-disulfide isomerase/thioredoxin